MKRTSSLCALCVLCGDKYKNEVVVVDAVRTVFGRAGEKGFFRNTRAEDLCVPLLKALIERNPAVKPEMIEDSIWGVTNQLWILYFCIVIGIRVPSSNQPLR
jgi:acetyl-CoA acetyltransferase